ncbi:MULTISPECIES: SLC13 family permease, partial [unclassified Rhodococcus (in: high G+C Gram-positive bacteria)]
MTQVGDDEKAGRASEGHEFDEVDRKSAGEREDEVQPGRRKRQWVGLGAGVLLALVVYLVLPEDVAHPARLTAATAVLMGIWWMTEAVPIPATALLPLVIFPVFDSGVVVNDVGASYGNNIIFLFMGGFLLALAMQRWNLHRR